MPPLNEHPGTKIIKMLYLGDPGSGKTGSLQSLVGDGFEVNIMDFDNLLGSLLQYMKLRSPDKIKNVHYAALSDKFSTNLGQIFGTPHAFGACMRLLDHWKIGDEDLGKPAQWGPARVLVIDSLTQMGYAAYRFADSLNPAAKDKRQIYFTAQGMLINVLSLLKSEDFATNVIVIAHVAYDKDQFEALKGFPRSIGSALNDQIGAFFNSVLMAQSQGTGANVKRVIRTNSTGIVDLKNPVPVNVPDTLPLETGLADFFKAVRA